MQTAITASKPILNDIVIMRLLLIVLLIVYHSFAPFCGAWRILDDGYNNVAYYWIAKWSYSFFLEAFVFISGIVAGCSFARHPKKKIDRGFLKKKFKRLIIPSIVFSILYFALYKEWTGIPLFCYNIIIGVAHMWFLPMLFWCFVGLFLVEKIGIKPQFMLLATIAISLCALQSLPFRIGNAMYYFFFFYLGILIPSGKLKSIMPYKNYQIIITVAVYLIVFILSAEYQYITPPILRLLRFVSSLTGLIGCYVIIGRLVSQHKPLPTFMITLSKYSFGVYIVQQFILIWLYYHTSLCTMVNYELIPWIGFFIALIVSLIITHLSLKTKIGNYLLGQDTICRPIC